MATIFASKSSQGIGDTGKTAANICRETASKLTCKKDIIIFFNIFALAFDR